MMTSFENVRLKLPSFKLRLNDEVDLDIDELAKDLNSMMKEFDKNWSEYERSYVAELMIIEEDARNRVKEAIKCEKTMSTDEEREAFLKAVCEINSVANT